MAKVKFIEKIHSWKGSAIIKNNDGLHEVDLGVAQSDKKLKETGAKELFTEQAKGIEGKLISIEVEKLADIETVDSMDSEEFKNVAKVEDVIE